MFLLRTAILFIFALLVALPISIAKDKPIEFVFLQNTPMEIALENGLSINFEQPVVDAGADAVDGSPYYTQRSGFLFWSGDVYTNAVGLDFVLKNNSSQVLVVRWAESALSVGNFSGMPFIGGMKFVDAGNPSVTPNTIIPPGQTLEQRIYVSRVYRSSNTNAWRIDGVPIPKDNSLSFMLSLKVLDSVGNGKYFTVTTPKIGTNLSISNQKK